MSSPRGTTRTLAAATDLEQLSIPPATPTVTPLTLNVPGWVLDDLRHRLRDARLPDRETRAGWAQGVPLDRLRDLTEYWSRDYDWRRLERQLNDLGQFRTLIDGVGIHFLHVRSAHADAVPIILSHGWPGSVVEFLKAIGPLTDPTAHGGGAADAFHVVIPSLPGFGFSDKPIDEGWHPSRIARAWDALMARLGYDRYLAQGGDWGGIVTSQLGKIRPAGLAGVHFTLPEFPIGAPPLRGQPTAEEEAALAQMRSLDAGSGYAKQQSTRPQTLGYGLADSPVGQAAWIYEKFAEWTDTDHDPEQVLTRDELLDNITLYWLTNTATSSARIYWEYKVANTITVELDLPVGVSVFPREIVRIPRIWAQRAFSGLIYFNDQIPAGGHFAAFEQPGIFVEEMRKFARLLR
ncbi:epoxide hydrolase family protein [Rugosimonospora africana]|uniref:Multidrug MFS transporter n=1 Tax=Rugosimonospora africana TaxID=556532 RepID=A0A8J3R1U9_9ACTN|nr:epoxide hydrolase family protein [Rugosimonospora africana]GIH20012.1 multidrug MFS transporter [Rugosimonospora africana]